MPEHVKKLLRLVEQGKIPLPLGLEVPECDARARVYGGLSLGGRASDYDALTERRREIHRKFMEAALTSPEEYSPELCGFQTRLQQRRSLAGRSKSGWRWKTRTTEQH
jgi:hypothetical protein